MDGKFGTAFCVLILGLVLLCGSAGAQAPAVTPELAKVIEAAKQEGVLELRSTSNVVGGPEGARAAAEGIRRMFGVDLKVRWSPGPGYAILAGQLFQELAANQKSSTDAYIATGVQILPYLDKNLFRTVDWTKLAPARIKPEMVEGDGKALRFTTFFPGILYNVHSAPWVPRIETLSDLLKPDYKGQFVTTPYLAAFDVMLADDVWGVAKTDDFVRRMSKQISGVLDCEGVDRIASGEIPALAVDCSGGAPNTLKYRDQNILKTQIISDMAERRYAYLTIPTNAPDPNAGILYTLYVSSPEGQERIVWDFVGHDLYDYPDSHMRRIIGSVEAKGTKFIDVTIDWWRSHQDIEPELVNLVKLIQRR